jgi:hypothetical protein
VKGCDYTFQGSQHPDEGDVTPFVELHDDWQHLGAIYKYGNAFGEILSDCYIVPDHSFYDSVGKWKPLFNDERMSSDFNIENSIFHPDNKVFWSGHHRHEYTGMLVKMVINCNNLFHHEKSCLMFKISGKRAYITKPPAPTTHETTVEPLPPTDPPDIPPVETENPPKTNQAPTAVQTTALVETLPPVTHIKTNAHVQTMPPMNDDEREPTIVVPEVPSDASKHEGGTVAGTGDEFSNAMISIAVIGTFVLLIVAILWYRAKLRHKTALLLAPPANYYRYNSFSNSSCVGVGLPNPHRDIDELAAMDKVSRGSSVTVGSFGPRQEGRIKMFDWQKRCGAFDDDCSKTTASSNPGHFKSSISDRMARLYENSSEYLASNCDSCRLNDDFHSSLNSDIIATTGEKTATETNQGNINPVNRHSEFDQKILM